MADDLWGTSTGLYTDFSGEVIESTFGTDARYNNGESTLLFWKVRPFDIELPPDKDTIEVSFGVGGGWHSYDGGETVEHADGKTKVNNSAWYGKLVDWALESGMADTLQAKGDSPLQSKIWTGLAFRFEEREFNFGGDIGKKKRVMPVEVLAGEGSAETRTDSTGDSKDALEGYGDELKALAENSPTGEAFTEAAMGLTGITDHASLVMQIAEGSLYETLKG